MRRPRTQRTLAPPEVDRQERGDEQRADDRAHAARDRPAGHVHLPPGRRVVHQGGLREADEGAVRRVEDRESEQEDEEARSPRDERERRGGDEPAADDDSASPATVTEHAEHRFEHRGRVHRRAEQQTYLHRTIRAPRESAATLLHAHRTPTRRALRRRATRRRLRANDASYVCERERHAQCASVCAFTQIAHLTCIARRLHYVCPCCSFAHARCGHIHVA